MPYVRDALADENWERVAAFLTGRFEVEVEPAWAQKVALDCGCSIVALRDRAASLHSPVGWSDGTWLMWWKQKLLEAGKITGASAGLRDVGEPVSAVFHVFDIHWETTPEMQERLENDRPEPEALPATSKVFTTNLVPRPVDRVAARVAPGTTKE